MARGLHSSESWAKRIPFNLRVVARKLRMFGSVRASRARGLGAADPASFCGWW
jgi:hypothetical protein